LKEAAVKTQNKSLPHPGVIEKTGARLKTLAHNRDM
jgi:hypothetical protein